MENKLLPIDTAPDGYAALGEPSEWFLALASQKYMGPQGSRWAVIRRIHNVGFGPWEGSGEEYYKADFFSHWMPLPEVSTEEKENGK